MPVAVGLDAATLATALTAGRATPALEVALALVDTGADMTCVAADVLARLNATFDRTLTTQTMAGPVAANLYRVSVSLLSSDASGTIVHVEPNRVVMEMSFPPLPGVDVLFGLDILRAGRLLIDGPAGTFEFDF